MYDVCMYLFCHHPFRFTSGSSQNKTSVLNEMSLLRSKINVLLCGEVYRQSKCICGGNKNHRISYMREKKRSWEWMRKEKKMIENLQTFTFK